MNTTRERLYAMGCHLDAFDARVAAGEDPEVVAADVVADWRRKRAAEEAADAAREAAARPSGRAQTAPQRDRATATIRPRR